MNAIRLHEFGPAENLRLEEADAPRPGPGQVRIAVAAAGVHFIDTAIRAGRPMGPSPLPGLPAIPGREVAGVVDEVGAGVDGSWLGRRVVAHLGPAGGGYAEQAVRDVAAVHTVSGDLGHEAAVAMIGTGRTALMVLGAARPDPGDVVLVTAAAGGLGTLLVQGARAAGATVVGVAGSPAKVRRARWLGADVAVDSTAGGWDDEVREALGRDVSLVLDGVGGEVGRRAFELLGRGGRVLQFGWSSGAPAPIGDDDLASRGVTRSTLARPDDLRPLEARALAAAAERRLVPSIEHYALADAADAHRDLEERRTLGKVVLVPGA